MTDQFDLTDDQREIQELARRFTADRITPFAAEWDEKHIFPRDTIKQAAELGPARDEKPRCVLEDAQRELEARAAGLPVVAMAGSGVDDIVEHEVDGLLVPDDTAMTAAIRRVVDDADWDGQQVRIRFRPDPAVWPRR